MKRRPIQNRLRIGGYITVILIFCAGNAFAEKVRVFAAASTTNPLSEIVKTYDTKFQIKVATVFAASGTIARQIDEGAPVDIFLSANPKWMDWLQRRKRIIPGSRFNLVGNCLALVTSKLTVPLPPLSVNFLTTRGNARIAIGDPNYVPVGEYAMSALKKLGLWENFSSLTALLPSARHVLYLVERGEVLAGIVYRSDALTSKRIRISEAIDPRLHAEIVYPVALIGEQTPKSEVLKFYKFLNSKISFIIFEKYGFRLLGKRCLG